MEKCVDDSVFRRLRCFGGIPAAGFPDGNGPEGCDIWIANSGRGGVYAATNRNG